MKIIYTNISPVSAAYTNLNHIYYLNKLKPSKVYLCVWDNFVFEHNIFQKNLDNTKNKVQKLQENVQIIEKLMSFLNIDYKIIYLSEAWARLFRNSDYSSTFQKILSHLRIKDLKEGFEIEYIPFDKISLSKINYIIADYLIAMYLPELFPEICSTQPTHYLTSERFRVFHGKIDSYIESTYQKYEPPATIFVKRVPVIVHPETEAIPSMEMSQEAIKEIVREYYKEKKISETEIHDLFAVLTEVLDKLYFKEEVLSFESLKNKLKKSNKSLIIETISLNLYKYFSKVQSIIQKENVKERNKSLFIAETGDFERNIKPLNPLKLKILQYCDGTNTSLDIARKTGLKLSTVSSYLTHLKIQKLISNDRKPKRNVDSIVINLKDMV